MRYLAPTALAILLAMPPGASATVGPPVPPLSGPIVDQARVLGEPHRSAIAGLALELKQKTGVEIAVLSVKSVAPLDIFSYGMRVAEAWGLGEAGKDNGLLLLIAIKEQRIRFFTGYGLEGILPDGKTGAILDTHVMPRIKGGDIGGGIYAGVRAAAEIIAADAGVKLSGRPLATPGGRVRRRGTNPFMLGYLLFFGLPGLFRRRRRGMMFMPLFFGGGLGQGFGGGFGGGGLGGGFGGLGGGFGGGGAGRGW
ncbi:MAG: TPM domain-containing protein [Deltaproteobacteria bacterium]